MGVREQPEVATVLVPADRVVRWFANFERGHGAATYRTVGGALRATAEDGSTAEARPPFDASYSGPPGPEQFAASLTTPARWGLLLVRKGGFAVARLDGTTMTAHKVGRRHVQGRTKAGGQSQQRFARRRDNQAQAAYAAAADHAARVLGPVLASGLEALVTGGDRAAVAAVLADPRLGALRPLQGTRWLATGDPGRAVLDRAVVDARAAELRVHNG